MQESKTLVLNQVIEPIYQFNDDSAIEDPIERLIKFTYTNSKYNEYYPQIIDMALTVDAYNIISDIVKWIKIHFSEAKSYEEFDSLASDWPEKDFHVWDSIEKFQESGIPISETLDVLIGLYQVHFIEEAIARRKVDIFNNYARKYNSRVEATKFQVIDYVWAQRLIMDFLNDNAFEGEPGFLKLFPQLEIIYSFGEEPLGLYYDDLILGISRYILKYTNPRIYEYTNLSGEIRNDNYKYNQIYSNLKDYLLTNSNLELPETFLGYFREFLVVQHYKIQQEKPCQQNYTTKEFVDLTIAKILPELNQEMTYKEFQNLLFNKSVLKDCYQKIKSQVKNTLVTDLSADVLSFVVDNYIN